jgi:hypothetical protein
MIRNIIRKIIVAFIILVPVFTNTDCKKQAKCGCGKDVLRTFTLVSAYVYWTSSATIYFQTVGDAYSYYYFCNPSEMFGNLNDAKPGDILQVSGHVYWDCNYVYQSSNSPYQSYQRIYQCQVTDLSLDLYGKGKPAPGAKLNPATQN